MLTGLGQKRDFPEISSTCVGERCSWPPGGTGIRTWFSPQLSFSLNNLLSLRTAGLVNSETRSAWPQFTTPTFTSPKDPLSPGFQFQKSQKAFGFACLSHRPEGWATLRDSTVARRPALHHPRGPWEGVPREGGVRGEGVGRLRRNGGERRYRPDFVTVIPKLAACLR